MSVIKGMKAWYQRGIEEGQKLQADAPAAAQRENQRLRDALTQLTKEGCDEGCSRRKHSGQGFLCDCGQVEALAALALTEQEKP